MRGATVSVVIPTRERPEPLRKAIDSVLGQDSAGVLEVLVVFDGSAIDDGLVADYPDGVVRVLANERTPGLAGARNTGVLAARGELIAFCDDDDVWLPGKLAAQLRAVTTPEGAEFVTTAMVVDCRGRRTERLAGTTMVDHAALLRSRMAMLHSSSFLIEKRVLIEMGLVEERLPRSMAEDWDLLLRASRRRPIVHVDRPLVEVGWGGASYFVEQWQVRNDAQLWLIEHHPDMVQDRRGAALAYGKLAFGCAALGQRRRAAHWAGRCLSARPVEPRGYLALAVAANVLRWRWVVGLLNRRGHGI